VNDLNLYQTKSDFTQLLDSGKIPDPVLIRKIKCLKFLLANKETTLEQEKKEVVKMENFGWMVSWFGSIYTNFLDNILQVIDKPWFHGDITKTAAEYQLRNKDAGTFLVRFSTASFGCFALSYVTNNIIVHIRFSYSKQSNTFESGNHKYSSIHELLTNNIQFLGLTLPCLGSKYVILDQEDCGYDSTLTNK